MATRPLAGRRREWRSFASSPQCPQRLWSCGGSVLWRLGHWLGDGGNGVRLPAVHSVHSACGAHQPAIQWALVAGDVFRHG
jgi:hypothetical protein